MPESLIGRTVVIEGSLTPGTEIPRGQRRTVIYTDRVESLIKKGRIVLVDGSPLGSSSTTVEEFAPQAVDVTLTQTDTPPPATPPAGNAKTEEWATFLEEQGIEFPKEHTRDQLIKLWEASPNASSAG